MRMRRPFTDEEQAAFRKASEEISGLTLDQKRARETVVKNQVIRDLVELAAGLRVYFDDCRRLHSMASAAADALLATGEPVQQAGETLQAVLKETAFLRRTPVENIWAGLPSSGDETLINWIDAVLRSDANLEALYDADDELVDRMRRIRQAAQATVDCVAETDLPFDARARMTELRALLVEMA